jgi:hypothetical protein
LNTTPAAYTDQFTPGADQENKEYSANRWALVRNYLISVLSGRHTGFIILVIVMFAKVLQFTFLLNTRDDISHQVMAAQNLYHGNGVSVPVILPSDLATVHYPHQIKWPPGYSIVFVPFYAMFQQNYLATVLFLYLLSAFLLLVICRAIMKLFEVHAYVLNSFTIIAGLSIYYFQLKPSSDSFATVFYLIALYYAFRTLKHNRKYKIHFVGITAALVLSASFKYLYIPIVFILPLFLFGVGALKRNSYLKKSSLLSFIILGVVIGSLLFWQKYSLGNFAYVQQNERGLYPENLARFHAFIPSAIVKPESLSILSSSGFFTSIIFQKILQGFHVLSLIFLGIYIFYKEKKTALKSAFSPYKFFMASFIIAVILTLLLGALSLFVKEETWANGETWTYIQEPRYYALVHILLLISLFVWYGYKRTTAMKKPGLIFFILIVLLLPETLRGTIFAVKRIRNFSSEEYIWQNELKFQKFTASLIEKEKQSKRIDKIVLSGSSDWMNWRASLYTEYPIFADVFRVNDLTSLKTSKPVILFYILRDSEIPYLQPFINSASQYKVGSYANYQYYSIPIYPLR